MLADKQLCLMFGKKIITPSFLHNCNNYYLFKIIQEFWLVKSIGWIRHFCWVKNIQHYDIIMSYIDNSYTTWVNDVHIKYWQCYLYLLQSVYIILHLTWAHVMASYSQVNPISVWVTSLVSDITFQIEYEPKRSCT